jgi:hypothetical protein
MTVVVLHEHRRQTEGREAILTPALQEESPGIPMHHWLEEE